MVSLRSQLLCVLLPSGSLPHALGHERCSGDDDEHGDVGDKEHLPPHGKALLKLQLLCLAREGVREGALSDSGARCAKFGECQDAQACRGQASWGCESTLLFKRKVAQLDSVQGPTVALLLHRTLAATR